MEAANALAQRLQLTAEQPKELILPATWQHDYSGPTTILTLRCPLRVNGVINQGTWLCGVASPSEKNSDVCFTLEFQPNQTNGEKYVLGRVAWRSSRIHNNSRGPHHLRRTPMFNYYGTYQMNLAETPEDVRRYSLPIAMPMPDHQTYDELLAFSGNALAITNMNSVPEPWDIPFSLQP